MEFTVTENRTLCISIDANLYEEAIVYKCFYWYGGAYSTTIEKAKQKYAVTVKKKDHDISDTEVEMLVAKIKNDLIDYKTRQIIQTETKNIKEILIAKAFSKLDEFDEAPKGIIDDPLGFKFD